MKEKKYFSRNFCVYKYIVGSQCGGWQGKSFEESEESKQPLLLMVKRRSGGMGMPETMYL
jgi:hypothetical protein